MTDDLEVSLDFDSLKSKGAMIGSGGLVVMDENTCLVEVARFFMNLHRTRAAANAFHVVREPSGCLRSWSGSLPEMVR